MQNLSDTNTTQLPDEISLYVEWASPKLGCASTRVS